MKKTTYSLRPLQPKDASRMLEWMHDEDTTQFLRLDGKSATIETTLKFIDAATNEGSNLHRAIVDIQDSYLGTVSLKNIDLEKQEAEYAISMHPCARGTGAAFDATKQILKIAFEEQGLRRVYLNVLEENKRAIRFYEKLEFEYKMTTDTVFYNSTHKLRWYDKNRKESKKT